MNSYQNPEDVREYIEARLGMDGRWLIKQLRKILPSDSKVLELGMGPGTDLLLMSEFYLVTGSDSSEHFINEFLNNHPSYRPSNLDAVTIETTDSFDCIYSNKVLHHLSENQLNESLKRQCRILNPGGILFHSFWLGDEKVISGDLEFNKYPAQTLIELFSRFGEITVVEEYREMNSGDSLLIAVRPNTKDTKQTQRSF